MSTPTLPASWTPTQAGCLRTGDYWVWEYNAKAFDARTVLGGPSQISACFPSTWEPSLTYAGTACPPQYTSACQDGDTGAVTCCPTVYQYTCQPSPWNPGVHAEMFRCASQYGSTGTMTVTQTDFAVNTLSVQGRMIKSNLHLFALAIMYAEPTSTALSPGQTATTNSASSSLAPTATDEPANDTPGLNSGQIAGVAVGAAAGGFIIGFVAWFLFRRRKGQTSNRRTASDPPSELMGPHSRAPSSNQAPATELESEDPMPWGEAVKHPWQIRPS